MQKSGLWKKIHSHKGRMAALVAVFYLVAAVLLLVRAGSHPGLYPQEEAHDILMKGPFLITEDGLPVEQQMLPYSPSSKKVAVVELRCTLPEVPMEHAAVVTTLYQTQLEVLLEEMLLYQSPGIEQDSSLLTPGSAKVSAPLAHDFAGKTLTLRYHRLVPGDRTAIQPVLLQNPYHSAAYQIDSGSRLLLVVLSTLVCLGVVLLMIAVVLDPLVFYKRPLFFLALFVVLAPVWILCNTKLAQFFTQNPVLLHTLEYMSFYLCLLPMWVFIRLNWDFCRRAIRAALHVMAGFNLLAVWLGLLGLADFFVLLPLFHLILVMNVVLFGYCAVQSRKSSDRSLRLFFNGFFIGGVAGLADLVRFYFFPDFTPLFSVVGIIGIVFCVVASFIASVQRNVQAQIENSIYKEMAHTDRLTGLYNRLSFELDVERLEKEPHRTGGLLFVNLDVNKFKDINDTYGHVVGDRVLKAIGVQLQACFKGVAQCYRMGGDEFCLVAVGQSTQRVEALLEQLNQRLARCVVEFPVSVAYGVAEYNSFLHQNLMEVFRDADDRMYLHKRGNGRRREDRR